MRVAIIGTRKPGIPQAELALKFMLRIPVDALVTSGNAEGTDQISKGWTKNIQYLPWNDYNVELGLGYKHCVAGGIKIFDGEIYRLWPYLAACEQGVMRLVRRNCCIILGRDGTQPVDAVYYYANEKNGVVQGGTKYGVELARSREIPCYNLKEATK
jgi:hypothetical protein